MIRPWLIGLTCVYSAVSGATGVAAPSDPAVLPVMLPNSSQASAPRSGGNIQMSMRAAHDFRPETLDQKE